MATEEMLVLGSPDDRDDDVAFGALGYDETPSTCGRVIAFS